MPVGLYFNPDGYDPENRSVMGRRVAGQSFLKALLGRSGGEQLQVLVEKQSHAEAFTDFCKRAGYSRPVKISGSRDVTALKEAGCIYFPSPDICRLARERSLFGPASWSIMGVTHTTATAAVMDELAALVTAPVYPWDALVCTSEAVKHNVMRIIDGEAGNLRDRLGLSRIVLPQMPVIPLGIHTDDFAFNENERAAARLALGADKNTHVVLFLGRLSFHAKANPLAMYRALEMAAQKLAPGERILLAECGWFANDGIKAAFDEAAANLCPSVQLIHVDGRDPQRARAAWAAADIFSSLSDNIQETFGLTPIEAMAAGLPVVVTDWDGMKDTVREGIDGYRIPTLMPGAGSGTDLGLRHALEIDTYDVYCGWASALVAVDIEKAANAFSSLMASPELRKNMGTSGRERARQVYDWSAVLGQYEALWAELGEIRQKAIADGAVPAAGWPARPDPFHAFSAYPTDLQDDETLFSLAEADAAASMAKVEELVRLNVVNYASALIPNRAEFEHIFKALEAGPHTTASLLAGIAPDRIPKVRRALVWMAKIGCLKWGWT
jgi:starch synthase